MTDHSWATDVPPHLMISGVTGSGKTVLSKQLFAEIDRYGLFIDTMKVVNDVGDYTVESVPKVKEAFAKGAEKVVFRPHWDDEKAYDEQIRPLINFIFALSEKTSKGWIVVTDECHKYAPNGDKSSPICRLHTEGRNHDIKAISLSQRAASVEHNIITQSWQVWLGGYSEYQSDYLENFNLPLDAIRENGEHDALVIDERMEPVERVRAKERYV